MTGTAGPVHLLAESLRVIPLQPWIPQLPRPSQRPILKMHHNDFRRLINFRSSLTVAGRLRSSPRNQSCRTLPETLMEGGRRLWRTRHLHRRLRLLKSLRLNPTPFPAACIEPPWARRRQWTQNRLP